MDWGGTLNRLLRKHRYPDGREWTGGGIQRATGGRVSRLYVSRLRRNLIRDPGFQKILLISRAIGADLEEWVPKDPPNQSD